ncbi:MAG: hypothetical protein M1829_006296 [Trizodia sp. TS-e1964]|nr:MAG: hypothetical protein M1829_006296 [Trizodia sp. TS-e1964]
MSEITPVNVPGSSGEEEDYMSMVIPESIEERTSISSIRRRAQEIRDAEARAHRKSKAELAKAEREARKKVLETSLFESDNHQSNKGLNMMKRMGFTPGSALGKDGDAENASKEPIPIVMKEDRGGIGIDSERKRKLDEETEELTKRQRLDDEAEEAAISAFKARLTLEAEERRLEAILIAAQKIAERFCSEEITYEFIPDDKPLAWRSLVKMRAREVYERQNRCARVNTFRYDPNKGGSFAIKPVLAHLLPYDEPEDDALTEFERRDVRERISYVNHYLRENFYYCMWCKIKFPSEEMECCPGSEEGDHDE